MRDNDGRKLDHQTFEVQRLRAVEQVAQVLGLHRNTVYGWLAKYREGQVRVKGGRCRGVHRSCPGRGCTR